MLFISFIWLAFFGSRAIWKPWLGEKKKLATPGLLRFRQVLTFPLAGVMRCLMVLDGAVAIKSQAFKASDLFSRRNNHKYVQEKILTLHHHNVYKCANSSPRWSYKLFSTKILWQKLLCQDLDLSRQLFLHTWTLPALLGFLPYPNWLPITSRGPHSCH